MDDDQKKCGGISAIGIMTILVSLACIGVGGYNIDVSSSDFSQQNVVSTCRVETRIPFYLVVAGIINIVLIILRLIFQVRYFRAKGRKLVGNGQGVGWV